MLFVKQGLNSFGDGLAWDLDHAYAKQLFVTLTEFAWNP
jgi:hypothetical protein